MKGEGDVRSKYFNDPSAQDGAVSATQDQEKKKLC